MQENLPNFAVHEPSMPHESDDYLRSLGDARTARHASESGNSPRPEEVATALKVIRADIKAVYPPENGEIVVDESASSLEAMKQKYWERASSVGVEHGARPGYELDRYFVIDDGRSYDDIKDQIADNFPEGSIPRSALNGVETYSQSLDINPAHASTIMMEEVGRSVDAISRAAAMLEREKGLPPDVATEKAFEQFFAVNVPAHVQMILENYGSGDKPIRTNMNKSSFYTDTAAAGGEDAFLTLSKSASEGLVGTYDIQSHPYDKETLAIGNQIAQIPAMQQAMLQVHEDLVATSESYLQEHPERAAGNLDNFSEIFVPQQRDGKTELLPNPKLVRAMVNNIMPGIALSRMRSGKSVDQIELEDVRSGVAIASKEFKLFQSRIGQFQFHDDTRATVDLHSVFRVVCPANAMFPEYLTARLPAYFKAFSEAST